MNSGRMIFKNKFVMTTTTVYYTKSKTFENKACYRYGLFQKNINFNSKFYRYFIQKNIIITN